MIIDITSKEYRDLLDILHLADIVMSGHRKEEDARTSTHRALTQKLYALANGEGLDSLIRRDDKINAYTPTGDFEQQTLAHKLFEEFGDHLFWDQLIDRLSARDAAHMAGGIVPLQAISEVDRRHTETMIRQRYLTEFSTNGIANLEVVERFTPGSATPTYTSD